MSEINITELDRRCPNLTDFEFEIIEKVSFYVEGISLSIVAIFGIIFNLLSSFILVKKGDEKQVRVIIKIQVF